MIYVSKMLNLTLWGEVQNTAFKVISSLQRFCFPFDQTRTWAIFFHPLPPRSLSMLSTTQQTAPQGSTLGSSTITPIITNKKNKKNCHYSSFTIAGTPRLLLHIPPSSRHGGSGTSQLCSAWTGSEAWRVEDRAHSYVCKHWAIEKGYHWGVGRAAGGMRRGG